MGRGAGQSAGQRHRPAPAQRRRQRAGWLDGGTVGDAAQLRRCDSRIQLLPDRQAIQILEHGRKQGLALAAFSPDSLVGRYPDF